MTREQGTRLTKAEKEELAEKALTMNCKGKSVTYIAEELEVNWKTAKGLVDFALKKRDIDEDEERERSLAHHRSIIQWCWEQLEDEEMGAHAQNRPAYIARIQASQAEIDRLNNVTPPLRTQQDINFNYRDKSLDEYFAALDAFRNSHGELNTVKQVDS